MSQAFLCGDTGGHRVFFTFNHVGKHMIYSTEEKTGFELYHLALASDHNHGFPSVFHYEDTLFCLPETPGSDQLFLFKFDPESLKITPFRMLLEGYEAMYPTMFQHNGLWWLLFYISDNNGSKVQLYWADDLHLPFQPHAMNPLPAQEPSLIPAGPIIQYKDKLLRPMLNLAGKQSVIELQEVVSLTKEHFETAQLKSITTPDKGNLSGGLVHLSGNEHYTVITSKRPVFTFSGLGKSIKI